ALASKRCYCLLGAGDIELHLPPQEPTRVETPQVQIGIHHGDTSPLAIAHRPRVSASALGPHAQGATRVQIRQRATTCPHRMDVEDGHFDWAPGYDSFIGGTQLCVTQRHVRGGPPHIKRNSTLITRFAGDAKRPHDPTSRSREHSVYGFLVGARGCHPPTI